MANEAQLRASLRVLKRSGTLQLIDYRSPVPAFNVTVSGTKGPTPGSIAVTTYGTDVDLSELTTPGLCVIHNQDASNYVEVGVWDPETSKFYPLAEVGPGECYLLKLSRNLGVEYAGTGTGTTAETNRLRLKANTASCNVRVDAFEK